MTTVAGDRKLKQKVRPGRILFEMEGVTEETAREALRLAQMKLSVASEFVSRTPPEE